MNEDMGGPITTLMAAIGLIGMIALLIEAVIALLLGWVPLLDDDYVFFTVICLWVLGVGLHGEKPEWGL